jgi:hypothetical protein
VKELHGIHTDLGNVRNGGIGHVSHYA